MNIYYIVHQTPQDCLIVNVTKDCYSHHDLLLHELLVYHQVSPRAVVLIMTLLRVSNGIPLITICS